MRRKSIISTYTYSSTSTSSAWVGDVAYWDGSSVKTIPYSKWSISLGTPVGVVVVPEGFAPDGRARIISLLYVDKSGNTSTSTVGMAWGPFSTDTSLTNFTRVPTTDNAGSTSSGSADSGYLPSDKFTGATSFVDPKAKYKVTSNFTLSPYLGDAPNPEYNKEISGYNNALSDFNGLSNTQTLVGLGSDYVAANACWKYNDGASNLQWYLPAMGELGYLMPRLNVINNTVTTLGGLAVIDNGYGLYSSSEYNSLEAIYLNPFSGNVAHTFKSTSNCIRPFAILDNSEDSGGGSKTINYIRMSYKETGPDEYRVLFVADFTPASIITFEMRGDTTHMGVRDTTATLTPFPEVPTLEKLTYSPKEDDTYIYEVIMA